MPKQLNSVETSVSVFEKLWKLVTEGREPLYTNDQSSEPQGNHLIGHRNEINTWKSRKEGYAIQAQAVEWEKHTTSADASGSRCTLKIKKNKKVVCIVNQKGPSKTDKFTGADERYVGTEETPKQNWKVTQGKLPLSLRKLVEQSRS